MTQSDQSPGERRLSRPPSDRYRAPDPGEGPADGPGPATARHSPRRAALLGGLVAAILAAAITVAGGVLLITAGLLAIAGIGGWLVAVAVRSGAGGVATSGQRIALSIGLALAGVALGQLGLWAYAELEGGALGPVEYLAETFGFLVPLELALGAVAAWLAAR